MTDLLENTCKLISTEGRFNMQHYRPFCGSACCIAGNILLADGMSMTDLKAIPWNTIPVQAREAWARNYGPTESSRLAFDEGGWGDLDQVTPDEAIAHLRGANPVYHSEPGGDDE